MLRDGKDHPQPVIYRVLERVTLVLQIEKLLEQYEDKMKQYRRWIHAHPEISGQEKETAAYIAQTLRDMGLTPVEGVGGYGVTAVIEGNGGGRCIALRADFDALPMEEQTGLPYSSQNAGVCHACGHDMHTAMLLGAAHVLLACKDSFSGSVKLIFQPSEENAADSGAKKMIADGVLENPKVDAIIGQHVHAQGLLGTVRLRKGANSAGSDRFFITVRGKSCHAAKPHEGIDAIVIAAQIVSALQTIVARNVDPLKSAAITIGTICGGTQYNVVAEECVIEGTCRNLDPAVRAAMPERMENIIRGIVEGMGGTYDFRYVMGYSPVINDETMFNLICETARQLPCVKQIDVPESSSLGGEDFSFFAERVPGVFYRIGTHREGTPVWPAHNGRFAPDEAAMKIGASVMVHAAVRYLNLHRGEGGE